MQNGTKPSVGPLIASGCVVAIVAAIPFFFFIGIGGALIAVVSGAVLSIIASVVVTRAQERTQESLEPQTQISGILDSSQLDAEDGMYLDDAPLARHSKKIAVVAALVGALAAGGIVATATNGVGINFYLGGNGSASSTSTPSTSSTTRQSSSTTTTASETTYEPETTETWYPTQTEEATATDTESPTESSGPVETTYADTTTSNDQGTKPNQGTSTSQGHTEQTTTDTTQTGTSETAQTSSGDAVPTNEGTQTGATITNETTQE